MISRHYTTYATLGELVQATARGEVDVAVTNLTITEERAELVNFTQPWFDGGIRIMVADDQSSGLGALIDGLSSAGHLQTCGWMLLIVLGATLALTLFDRRFDPNFPRRWPDGLAEGFYTVMSVATCPPPARRGAGVAPAPQVCPRGRAADDRGAPVYALDERPPPGRWRDPGNGHRMRLDPETQQVAP